MNMKIHISNIVFTYTDIRIQQANKKRKLNQKRKQTQKRKQNQKYKKCTSLITYILYIYIVACCCKWNVKTTLEEASS